MDVVFAEQTFNWIVLDFRGIGTPVDDQAFVGEAIYVVAVRPRLSAPFGRLRNFVRGGAGMASTISA